jgi:hypothetical protein
MIQKSDVSDRNYLVCLLVIPAGLAGQDDRLNPSDWEKRSRT